MIYIALNVIFNAFILFLILVIGSVIGIVGHTPEWVLWEMAFLVSAILTIIGYTKSATFLVGLFIPSRKMIGREKSKLEPLLSDVIAQVNKEYTTNYQPKDFKIKVSEDKITNAFALWYNTLIINRGAFDALNDEQLRAIMAHEFGHLYYRDSVRSIALIFSSFATRVVMWLYGIYIVITSMFAKNAKGEVATAAGLAVLVPMILFLPIIILNEIGSRIFYLLNMGMSRGAEYRADAFVASLGYKADMISALEVIDNTTVTNNSFIAKLMATHPSPMQRIGALEDENVVKKKIGKLFVATPFATNNNNVGGNSEIIRLTVILVIVGIGWCSIRAKEMLRHKQVANAVNTLQSVGSVKR
jgi:Zn-dependent protease with chaperone function